LDGVDNDVYYKGKVMKGSEALQSAGIPKITLGAKEGLSITNGSSFSAGMACLAYHEAQKIYKQSSGSCALACEALLAEPSAFEVDIHDLRNQLGQSDFAKNIWLLTEGSKMLGSFPHIQDAYSIRCSPQVHGVLYDRLEEFNRVLTAEINATTDNPVLDLKQRKFLSGGNFHGEYIGQYVESLKVAVTEVGAITERRIARIMDPSMSQGLPAMLVETPGLNSGYMMIQYTAVALGLQNVKASVPDTVLSLPTCNNQEDHNSNAYNAVLSLLTTIVPNVSTILSLEILCATRALLLRFHPKRNIGIHPFAPEMLGRFGRGAYEMFQPLLDGTMVDHSLQEEMKKFKETMDSEAYLAMITTITTQPQQNIPLATPRGTLDHHPKDMEIRNLVMSQIQTILVQHGVQQIDTPIFELRSTLFGKYGDESKKLVFDLNDEGGSLCTLRFDLTVPFARYMAQHNLTKLRRFQCGPVFRRDAPAMTKGRCRQFIQFDVDFAGKYDLMVPDAEIIKIMSDVLSNFRLDFVIKFNHKALLDEILEICQVPKDKILTTCSSIDKLDKEPWEKVKIELGQKGLPDTVIHHIEEHIVVCDSPLVVLSLLRTKYAQESKIQAILNDIHLLFKYLKAFNCLDKLVFDLSLARGLSYYTGIIIEATLKRSSGYGSIAAGGSYANLIGMFAKNAISAVGCSFGVERIFAILKEREMGREPVATTKCYVTFIRDKHDEEKNQMLFEHVLDIASKLWRISIATEMVSDCKEMMAVQIHQTVKKGIRYMILIGEAELQKDQVLFKDLVAKSQITVARDSIIEFICGLKGINYVTPSS
jgi:histidyl-tRNA synthetase